MDIWFMCGLISSYISYFDVIIRILAIAWVTLGQWLQHVKLLPSPARNTCWNTCECEHRSSSVGYQYVPPFSLHSLSQPALTIFVYRIAEASIEAATSRCLSWSNCPGVARLEKGAMPARSKSLVICYIAMGIDGPFTDGLPIKMVMFHGYVK